MDQEHIYSLIKKFRDNTASEAEKEELLNWYRQKAYQDAEFPESEDSVGDFMRARLNSQIKPSGGNKKNRTWLAAAAFLILLGVTGVLMSKFPGKGGSDNNALSKKNDISPGGNKAILTLADGSKISLNDAGNGKIASQNGIRVTQAANGQLIYTIKDPVKSNLDSDQTNNAPIAYNTIETPKGGQYQVVLPDGSKVWLNAFSSIKFPLSFAATKERRVELKGEAYFEVVHDEKLPFKVQTEMQEVEDLGTHFNINAYADEASTKTSLLEGKVRVTAGSRSTLLVPGQQATLTNDFKISKVNTEEVIAWKNGYFNFDDERLENVMKSIARWYNVTVVYQDESLKSETFGAVTTRFANISTLLKIMEQTGDAHFSIEGSTIKISKSRSTPSIKNNKPTN